MSKVVARFNTSVLLPMIISVWIFFCSLHKLPFCHLPSIHEACLMFIYLLKNPYLIFGHKIICFCLGWSRLIFGQHLFALDLVCRDDDFILSFFVPTWFSNANVDFLGTFLCTLCFVCFPKHISFGELLIGLEEHYHGGQKEEANWGEDCQRLLTCVTAYSFSLCANLE